MSLIAHVVKTSAQSGITTETNITGLSITWEAIEGRVYRIDALVRALQASASGTHICGIDIDGTRIGASTLWAVLSGSHTVTHTPWAVYEPLVTGSVTATVDISTSAGSVTADGSSTSPSRLMVDDITPTSILSAADGIELWY